MRLKHLVPPPLRKTIEQRINSRLFGLGYLTEKGWFEGSATHQSLKDGKPVPWITYPAFEVLDRALRPDWRLFEYGTGNSSIWYASKVAEVIAVEHDPNWAAQVRSSAPANLTVTLFEKVAPDVHGFGTDAFETYAQEPERYGPGYFNVFVVDGMARNRCAEVASEMIAPHGIIVWDNAERWQYNEGFAMLGAKGWRRIDFYGPGPIQAYEWCTSIFARDLDWLPADLTITEARRYPLR